jgi:predicted metal-dependent hydrolase
LPPPPSLAVSSNEIVAHVGDAAISKETVLGIAKAQNISPREATELAVRDALFAQEALARRLDVLHERDLDATLAKALAASILEQVKAEGPIRDDEITQLVAGTRTLNGENYSYLVDRPEAWVTVHAVVKIAKDADEDTVKRAKKVADAIRDAVKPIGARAKETIPLAGPDHEGGQFLDVAKAVDKQGFDVAIEALPPVGADSFTVLPNGRSPFDPRFTAGAVALKQRGDLSEPVRSDFGWHVIMLLDRIPGQQLSMPELKELFEDYVYDARARKVTEPLLAELRKSNPSDIVRNSDALLALIHVGDDLSQAAQVRP